MAARVPTLLARTATWNPLPSLTPSSPKTEGPHTQKSVTDFIGEGHSTTPLRGQMGTSERPRRSIPGNPSLGREALSARATRGWECRLQGHHLHVHERRPVEAPGSVGTYYLVNLPGNGAEGMTATASN